jgi:hypothetical protein
MVAALQRLWDSVRAWPGFVHPDTKQKPEEFYIGKYRADYSPVTPEEVAAINAETAEFLKSCKSVSQ